MAEFLAVLANPAVIAFLLSILEAWASNKNASTAQQQTFENLAQTLRDLGAKNAKSRFESALTQEQQIAQQWKDEQAPPVVKP